MFLRLFERKNFLKIEEKNDAVPVGCGCGMVLDVINRNLPLGQATALFQSSVLFVTILSFFYLGLVCRYRWISVITGISQC